MIEAVYIQKEGINLVTKGTRWPFCVIKSTLTITYKLQNKTENSIHNTELCITLITFSLLKIIIYKGVIFIFLSKS